MPDTDFKDTLEKHRRNLLAMCVAVWIVIGGGVGPPEKLTLWSTGIELLHPEVLFVVGLLMLLWFLRQFESVVAGRDHSAMHRENVHGFLTQDIEKWVIRPLITKEFGQPADTVTGVSVSLDGQRVVYGFKSIHIPDAKFTEQPFLFPLERKLSWPRSLYLRTLSWSHAMWQQSAFWDFIFPTWFGRVTLVIATLALVLSLGWDISLIDVVVSTIQRP